jgi:phosphopantothenoylcysteine decarboxylase/phosphopantothenate--cysteine ligase
MRCLVTAGPTFEPLDQVRRLTNFSTGRLGSELVNFLAERGHEVTLLIGQLASWRGERRAARVETFTTTADLGQRLRAFGGQPMDAVFHAAAVSDFTFGKVLQRSEDGKLTQVQSGKLSTREGTLLAELVPTPKIIAELRSWFPNARLIGWKYEVEGDREQVVCRSREQIRSCRTDACVANGPGYGPGFGLITANAGQHHEGTVALFKALEQLVT